MSSSLSLDKIEPAEETPGLRAGDAEVILRERAEALHRRVWKSALASNVAAWVLLPVLDAIGTLNWQAGIIWASILTATLPLHIALNRTFSGQRPSSLKTWIMASAAVHVVKGLIWGLASVGLVADADILSKVVIVAVVLGNCAGAVASLGSYLPVYLGFIWSACLPMIYIGFASGDPLRQMGCVAIAIFLLVMTYLGRDLSRSFRSQVVLRLRAEHLARDLRKQHEIAVRANKAKSSFLAAASHDLRQPVHALGLLVGALRGTKMDAQAKDIVKKIETSVVSLEGLFNALLDISQLDAGVVSVQARPFRLNSVFQRVCQEYSEAALFQGTRLSFVKTGAVVLSDPVLVERILRNLVSNAVRHTAKGRILIGCRKAAGGMRVMVVDNGAGIAPEDHDRIFDEFVQLGNPERDRSKGLGLGLAIVRRTVALLDSRLTLKSTVGRGSCFEFILPDTDLPVEDATPGMRPATGFIILVEDEDAIREATASLLLKWGHRVVTATGGNEALAQLAKTDSVPDLLLCDYRLRNAETGLDVVRRIGAACGRPIPAILVSGDTAADRLIDAHAAGVKLLHKPTPPGALRAAINAALLSARPTSLQGSPDSL